jgi:hypothetical protein
MADETNRLLEQIVQELRGMRRDIASIQEQLAPFVEERRSAVRMQSPLMGVDLFREPADDPRRAG